MTTIATTPPPRRFLVCGGRDFDGHAWAFRTLDALTAGVEGVTIIQGGARGADAIARDWAKRRGVPCETFAADWRTHGRAAGPIRNQRMLDEGKPDYVVAFEGGRGTDDMLARAERAGVGWQRMSRYA